MSIPDHFNEEGLSLMPLPALAPNNEVSTGKVAETKKVLIVDDDIDTSSLLKIILEPYAYEVFTANSGMRGVELARELNPDVMIIDLLMPGMDGLNVCIEVRKFSNMPILVLSAVDRPGIVTEALHKGADDYLCKPLNSNVLIANLNKLIRRARADQKPGGSNGRNRTS